MQKRDDGKIAVKLGDFGLARHFESLTHSATTETFGAGTANFKAPEAWPDLHDILSCTGVDTAADVWSFACVLIQLITLHVPWTVRTDTGDIDQEGIVAILRRDYPRGSGICASLLNHVEQLAKPNSRRESGELHRNIGGANTNMFDTVLKILKGSLEVDSSSRIGFDEISTLLHQLAFAEKDKQTEERVEVSKNFRLNLSFFYIRN